MHNSIITSAVPNPRIQANQKKLNVMLWFNVYLDTVLDLLFYFNCVKKNPWKPLLKLINWSIISGPLASLVLWEVL